MKQESLKLMKCPYCGSAFYLRDVYQENDGEIIDGCIVCNCNEFPILDGILILKVSPLNKFLIKYIKERKTKEALDLSLDHFAEPVYGACSFVRSSGICGKAIGDLLSGLVNKKVDANYKIYSDKNLSFYALLGDGDSDVYLKNRFSAETFWSLYPFVPLLKESRERILDLSCGMGQSSFVISTYVKPQELFCADFTFRHLYLAKKYFAKKATFICLDANYPLPFNDQSFSSILMMDAFHYIRGRASLAREMERLISSQGLLLLLHLHNSLIYNPAAGQPLPPIGWSTLFKNLSIKILSEKNIVEDFLQGNKLDLKKKYTNADLNSSNALIIIGTKDKSLQQTYHEIWSDLLGNKSGLIINPIYGIERKLDRVILRRTFPSESFRKEYPLTEKYLPKECIINKTLAKALNGRGSCISSTKFSELDMLHIEELMRLFVIINVPQNYC